MRSAAGNSLKTPPPFWHMLLHYRRFFLLLTLAAFALRLVFYFKFPHVTGDSLVYGDIARNWLDRGIFGLTHAGAVRPTLIRLPGYPAFLAACFALFGREHYNAVLLVQIVIDVTTCFFIADLARRTVSEPAARFAFLLAALCPFTANYTVAPLTETLSIFFVAMALDAAAAGFNAIQQGRAPWSAWTWCGVSHRLRYLVASRWRHSADRPRNLSALPPRSTTARSALSLFWAGIVVLAVSLAPLVPWTVRNWRDLPSLPAAGPGVGQRS